MELSPYHWLGVQVLLLVVAGVAAGYAAMQVLGPEHPALLGVKLGVFAMVLVGLIFFAYKLPEKARAYAERRRRERELQPEEAGAKVLGRYAEIKYAERPKRSEAFEELYGKGKIE